MSLEQQPPKHDNVPVESLPPYPHDRSDTVVPPMEHRDKKGMSLRTKAGLFLATLGIAGTAGIVGKSMGGSEAAPTPDRSPAASATPNPGETAKEDTTTEFGISAAEFSANPELLAEEYYSQLNEYFIAGANEKSASADRKYEITMDEYIGEISIPIDQEFANNLFVEDWQSNPQLTEYVQSASYIASVARRVRILTYSGGTEDKEPYVRETLIDQLETTTDPLTTSVRWHERDNRDMNTAEEVLTGADPNTEFGGETLTWVEVDGQLKISDISHFDG